MPARASIQIRHGSMNKRSILKKKRTMRQVKSTILEEEDEEE